MSDSITLDNIKFEHIFLSSFNGFLDCIWYFTRFTNAISIFAFLVTNNNKSLEFHSLATFNNFSDTVNIYNNFLIFLWFWSAREAFSWARKCLTKFFVSRISIRSRRLFYFISSIFALNSFSTILRFNFRLYIYNFFIIFHSCSP